MASIRSSQVTVMYFGNWHLMFGIRTECVQRYLSVIMCSPTVLLIRASRARGEGMREYRRQHPLASQRSVLHVLHVLCVAILYVHVLPTRMNESADFESCVRVAAPRTSPIENGHKQPFVAFWRKRQTLFQDSVNRSTSFTVVVASVIARNAALCVCIYVHPCVNISACVYTHFDRLSLLSTIRDHRTLCSLRDLLPNIALLNCGHDGAIDTSHLMRLACNICSDSANEAAEFGE